MEVVKSNSGSGTGEVGLLQKLFSVIKRFLGRLATKEFWAEVFQILAQSAAVSLLSALGQVLTNVAKDFISGNSKVVAGSCGIGTATSAYAGAGTSYPSYSGPSRSAAPVMASAASRQGQSTFPGFG